MQIINSVTSQQPDPSQYFDVNIDPNKNNSFILNNYIIIQTFEMRQNQISNKVILFDIFTSTAQNMSVNKFNFCTCLNYISKLNSTAKQISCKINPQTYSLYFSVPQFLSSGYQLSIFQKYQNIIRDTIQQIQLIMNKNKAEQKLINQCLYGYNFQQSTKQNQCIDKSIFQKYENWIQNQLKLQKRFNSILTYCGSSKIQSLPKILFYYNLKTMTKNNQFIKFNIIDTQDTNLISNIQTVYVNNNRKSVAVSNRYIMTVKIIEFHYVDENENITSTKKQRIVIQKMPNDNFRILYDQNISQELQFIKQQLGDIKSVALPRVYYDKIHNLMFLDFFRYYSIKQYMQNNKNIFSLKNKLLLLYHICEGLIKIHQKDFVYLDLKSSNVLISIGLLPKLTDYESLCKCNDHDIVQKYNVKNYTIPYCAPQMFSKQQISKKFDIYSFGVLTLQLIFSQKFKLIVSKIYSIKHLNPQHQSYKKQATFLFLKLFLTFQYYENHTIFDIIRRCLLINPKQRPSLFVIRGYLKQVIDSL